jgi:quercetin dioxygenase-like cupin family protein|tara:strand:- start:2073 stop:2480 length:408 start_codon:yes stop_codon:yes gene_type:complete
MARCRLFAIDDTLKEISANGLYGKHLFGTDISVSVVKFVLPNGPDLPAKSHDHGEEISLQVEGGCSVGEGEGDTGDSVTILREGDVLVIPAGTRHYGFNSYSENGVSLRLNVVTPAREEFGPEHEAPYYPLKEQE